MDALDVELADEIVQIVQPVGVTELRPDRGETAVPPEEGAADVASVCIADDMNLVIDRITAP